MKVLNFTNHNIDLIKRGDIFTISPKYYKDFISKQEESMGDIILQKNELARLIVGLTELLHGT